MTRAAISPALPFVLSLACVLAVAAQRVPQISRAELPIGLGIAQVMPRPDGVLRFYRPPRVGDLPGDYPAADIVRFRAAVPSVDIAEAPPWLVPEHLKMDYEIFLLRVVTVTPHWLEVVGNSTTGETWWIDRADVRFTAWPEYLLGVPSVEAMDAEANPVRARPLDASPILSTARAALRVRAVQGDWIQVDTSELADRMPPEGWLRWRRGDRLLVTVNPLS